MANSAIETNTAAKDPVPFQEYSPIHVTKTTELYRGWRLSVHRSGTRILSYESNSASFMVHMSPEDLDGLETLIQQSKSVVL
jgi:hypothetical protein